MKQHVGPGHIYYLQDKHKSRIYSLGYLFQITAESCQLSSGQIVPRESGWMASLPCPCCDVHVFKLVRLRHSPKQEIFTGRQSRA